MANDKRMIAIVIAVADSVAPKYLAGAINSARAFEEWASRQGYETVLVTDEESGVTISLLRKKIEDLLKASDKPIHRIIVYFAGHGFIREIEEGLWLLSDWREELRAVAVEVLKRRLSMYGPRQVCIISDACRSLPSNIEQADLVPDAVLGAGPGPVDMTIAIDRFIAAQDGAEAFMIPGVGPDDDRCLFSGVLVEGLWGLDGLQEKPFSKLQPDKITSRSLGAYLLSEVPARAKTYQLTLTPAISPTFPEGDDYYFSKDLAVEPPKFTPWPPKRKPAGMGHAILPMPGEPTKREGPRTLKQLREQILPSPLPASSGIVVSGAYPCRFWLGKGRIALPISPQVWSITPAGFRSTPALIEFADGLFAATVVLPDHFASLVRDEHGVTGLVYRDPSAPPHIIAPTEEALADLDSGALRADRATDLAVQLREWKHADPILGVISAYLYDAIGDVDSIRRMASFYARSGEAIPYDIALLGGLHGTRTERGFKVEVPEVQERKPRTDAEKKHDWTYCGMKAREGFVGGLWPWMRQGWAFLYDSRDEGSSLILPGLVELRSGLTRSRFATFEKDSALALARLCGLKLADKHWAYP